MGLDTASDGTWLQRDHRGRTGPDLSFTPPIYIKKGQVLFTIWLALLVHAEEKLAWVLEREAGRFLRETPFLLKPNVRVGVGNLGKKTTLLDFIKSFVLGLSNLFIYQAREILSSLVNKLVGSKLYIFLFIFLIRIFKVLLPIYPYFTT